MLGERYNVVEKTEVFKLNNIYEFSVLNLNFMSSWIEFWFVNKEPKY